MKARAGNIMKEEEILNGLRFCHDRTFIGLYLYIQTIVLILKIYEKYLDYDILHIVPAKFYKYAKQIGLKRILPVYNLESIKVLDSFTGKYNTKCAFR